MTAPYNRSAFAGRLQLMDTDLQIAMGLFDGIREYSKFGTNLAVSDSYEHIWQASQLWTPLPAATTLEVASSSAADAAGGDGATMLMIQGLDADYLEIEEVVVLTGMTPAVTTQEFLFVNRAFIVAATGNLDTNAGDLYIADDSTAWTLGEPDTAAAIQVKILASNGFTQQAIYTVPAGVTAYVTDAYVSSAATVTKSVSFQIRHRDNVGGVARISMEGEVLNNTVSRVFRPYISVPEKYTIWLQTKVATGSAVASGGFNLILVDKVKYGLE